MEERAAAAGKTILRATVNVSSISACIPCFNAEDTLRAAVQSVRAQTVSVRELHVVDDGSTDLSSSIAAAIADRITRFPENLGRGAARQAGIETLNSEYILFCDATLALPPEFIERAFRYFSSKNVAAVFGLVNDPEVSTTVARWRERHLFKGDLRRQINHRASLMTGGVLLRRSAVAEAGGFDRSLRAGEDQDLGARLLAAGFDVISEPSLHLRPLRGDNLLSLLRRYARWNCDPAQPISLGEYLRSIRYHASLASRDAAALDFSCAILTMAAPHFMYWTHRRHPKSGVTKVELPQTHSIVETA